MSTVNEIASRKEIVTITAGAGKTAYDVADLMKINGDGRGMISIVRVTDLQDRPKLFSTFMLQMLAELYASCPEEGDF